MTDDFWDIFGFGKNQTEEEKGFWRAYWLPFATLAFVGLLWVLYHLGKHYIKIFSDWWINLT